MALEWLKTILGDKYTPESTRRCLRKSARALWPAPTSTTPAAKLKEAEAPGHPAHGERQDP